MSEHRFHSAPTTGPRPPLKGDDGDKSLRDYIAIHASDGDVDDMPWGRWDGETYVNMSRAERRYAFADAMLAARRG